jgi:hypothetical protein
MGLIWELKFLPSNIKILPRNCAHCIYAGLIRSLSEYDACTISEIVHRYHGIFTMTLIFSVDSRFGLMNAEWSAIPKEVRSEIFNSVLTVSSNLTPKDISCLLSG